MDELRCPICKRGNLERVDSSPALSTLSCKSCGRLITVKLTANRGVELLVPGLGVLASAATVLPFLGIKDFDDLLDLMGLI